MKIHLSSSSCSGQNFGILLDFFPFFSSTHNYWQLWQPWSNKVTIQLFTTTDTACLGQASHSWPSIAVTKTMIKSGVGREGSMWLTSHSPSLREAETMEDLLTGLLSGLAQTASYTRQNRLPQNSSTHNALYLPHLSLSEKFSLRLA